MARPRKTLSHYGRELTVIDLARAHGLDPSVLRARLRIWKDQDRSWGDLLKPVMSRSEAGRLGGLAR